MMQDLLVQHLCCWNSNKKINLAKSKKKRYTCSNKGKKYFMIIVTIFCSNSIIVRYSWSVKNKKYFRGKRKSADKAFYVKY